MTQLKGRTCLITGASSGLGAHFSRTLSAAGARVVLAARRLDRVQDLAKEIRATGNEAFPVAMDVSDEKSVTAAFDAAETAFGPVDTIIANAGVSAPGRSTEISIESMRSVLDTNVLGVLLTAREGARRMIAAGSRDDRRGRILLIGSITAEMTGQGETIYSASKAAVAHMGRNLAKEWARLGVNVNVIQPGYIQTELSGDWFKSEAGLAQISGFNRRRLQPVSSLDAPLLYLCSDESAYTTGGLFTIDDGQLL
ncbi:MAG: SDR family NAD(P)-dependent oxidoreductase [Sphingorhabdus sp.]|jgi:NAD(P)-dependent dehydrogenase (short-subunit alcohol dehydrogenase family)|uniref:SDR family NAD(P)-dependent oxidoreductase n=1 Tax=Sphingorhabdus sp. TaxID=1902408 RepID=UPI00273DB7AB|nr:SDR family NAD(P)-dependent oxidoreductase [Sphingorhabdus sp.]MDP4926311.1 SDR family NAD(P)-dependent oxidoreductase [Sphingorhabdus sp.]